MSKVLIRKSRQFSAVSLILAAFVIVSFTMVQRSKSANPTNGSISPTGPTLNWVGTGVGPASPDETTCQEGITCDTFLLTLTGAPADWAGKKARVTISAAINPIATDYDIFIHKGMSNSGPIVGSSATAGTPPEIVELDPNQAAIGTGIFSVHVVYFAATAADQYAGKVEVISGGPTPTPTPTPTGTPTPTPGNANAPRFVNYYAPPGVMEDAGEPTMGVNWNTENNPRSPNATRLQKQVPERC